MCGLRDIARGAIQPLTKANTMTKRSTYREGEPCWPGLSTPDLAESRRFYAAVLGWTFDEPDPGLANYMNARSRGEYVAGIVPVQPGVPPTPAWGVHFWADDMQRTAARITDAGGTVITHHPVRDLGVMLVATDRTGAVFGAWQPGQHRGAGRHDEPGALCWAEVYTRDPAATDGFYRSVFGYTQTPVHADKGLDYATYSSGGPPVCGRLTMTDAWPDVPPHWRVYFGVSDIEVALEKLRAAGGAVKGGPFPTPMGPAAVVTDPHGAVFTILQRPQSDE